MNEQLQHHEEKFKNKIRVYEQYSTNLANLATYTEGTEKQLKELLEKYQELQSLVNQTRSLVSATSTSRGGGGEERRGVEEVYAQHLENVDTTSLDALSSALL
eukprot:TRINITY_DN2795_c0_g1_i2.p2 TRINITY_DN2795_c0_g1~~TRINITY_DN2795_c0_g1_i2.p2  ORF type:complete len:103 (-),score=28.09 TRINITY_DN2795_c0_g1_i2:77-385(-)